MRQSCKERLNNFVIQFDVESMYIEVFYEKKSPNKKILLIKLPFNPIPTGFFWKLCTTRGEAESARSLCLLISRQLLALEL